MVRVHVTQDLVSVLDDEVELIFSIERKEIDSAGPSKKETIWALIGREVAYEIQAMLEEV